MRQLNRALRAKALKVANEAAAVDPRVITSFQALFDTVARIIAEVHPVKAHSLTVNAVETKNVETSRSLHGRSSLSNKLLVEPRGFEPLIPHMPCRRASAAQAQSPRYLASASNPSTMMTRAGTLAVAASHTTRSSTTAYA
jgi:hypothetical protein